MVICYSKHLSRSQVFKYYYKHTLFLLFTTNCLDLRKRIFYSKKWYPDNWAPNKWMKSINLPSQNSFGQFFHQKWQNKWSWMGDINKITHIIIQVNLHFFSLSFLSFEKRWSVSLKLMRSKLLWSRKYWKKNSYIISNI